ncbi:hypothetical protein QVD17_27915 [Tagetes erecta]|uniref:GATA transcription factor n=1 Tax=Tagetes erecta TaxID=13708 RepID=A0AAD8KA40_TARER|nr:hypothetical protein QVD17_27915 [Tagetes erecta]
MDVYGMSSAGQDVFGVDDLFDFSGDGDDFFTSSTATNLFTSSTVSGSQLQYNFGDNNITNNGQHHSTDITDHFCVPSDDVAELEWLSNFVDESITNFPTNNIAGTINFRPETPSFHSRSRTKRTRAPSTTTTTTWTSPPPTPTTQISDTSPETTTDSGVVRRCTHCASEKTPQWRTGPLGPKTLCNACGVRYKSGRLVPEYRPAASPTFVLTQHSNSHRKVMELRRQKEMMLSHQSHHHHQQQQQVFSPEQHTYSGRHHHQIC